MQFKHSIPILYSADIGRSINYYTQVLEFDNKWEWDDPPTFGGVAKTRFNSFSVRMARGIRAPGSLLW